MSPKAQLIVVMGVSGSGKSSVAIALAEHFGYEFVEADDFHPEENKQWMASAKPLTDEMREPWIKLLQERLILSADAGCSCVMSFSGLRRTHRARMRVLPFDIHYIHLEGSQNLISQRMSERADHFMPESLLDSQFDALEESSDETDITSVSIDQDLNGVVADAINVINNWHNGLIQ